MKKAEAKYPRLLAIAPSTRGFGFAVLEGQDTLVDWGVKRVEGNNKNTASLSKVEEIIAHYQPGVMILENTSTKDSRRVARIRELSQKLIATAETHEIGVQLFSREIIGKAFCADGKGTKYEIAKVIADRFPEELGLLLPPKRTTCQSNDYRMDIFQAVALVLVYRLRKVKRAASGPASPPSR